MTAAGIDLQLARREAESEMRETCRVTAPVDPSNPGEWNPVTLQYDPPVPVVSYEGKCKVRYGGTRGRAGSAGDQLYAEQDLTIAFPVLTSAAIGKDHVVEILTSEDDPGLLAAKFKIIAARAYTNATQRKLPATETQ